MFRGMIERLAVTFRPGGVARGPESEFGQLSHGKQWQVQTRASVRSDKVNDASETWPIIVINLAERTDRKAIISANLRRLNICYKIFEATDGRILSSEQVRFYYDAARNKKYFKRPLCKPEIGCFISHLRIWETIVVRNLPGAVILEDDAEIVGDFQSVVAALENKPLGAAIVRLDSVRKTPNAARWPLALGYHLTDPWYVSPGTTGYVITRAAAEILTRHAVPFARPVDNELKHWWEHGIDLLAVQPAVIRPDNATTSSISMAASRSETSTGLRRLFANLVYQGRFQLGLCKARRKQMSASNLLLFLRSLAG